MALLLFSPLAQAQGLPEAPVPKVTSELTVAEPIANAPVQHPFYSHHFYDRTAKIELALVLTAVAFDNAQTCHNLANGGREVWLPTQKCPQITLILTAQLAAQEGAAYLLHRTHHHRLERVVRLFTIEENVRGILYSKRHGAW